MSEFETNLDKMSLIYKATNFINGKVYIGKTTKSMSRRRTEHESSTSDKTRKFRGFKGAIQKYGPENFLWEVLEYCLKEDSNQREMYYIELYRSNDSNFGYNLTNGGDGAPFGDLNPSKRPEVREKLRIANTGFKHTPETLLKMSVISKEYYKNGMPEEQRRKISEAQIGVCRTGKGKDCSSSKKCVLVDPDGNIHYVHGIREFADENGLDNSAISKLIYGKLKTHKGWRLYVEDDCGEHQGCESE